MTNNHEALRNEMAFFWKLAQKGMIKPLSNLHNRWLDEREHEDFKGYIETAKKLIPEGYEFVNMTKRPFQMTVRNKNQGSKWSVSIKCDAASLKYIA